MIVMIYHELIVICLQCDVKVLLCVCVCVCLCLVNLMIIMLFLAFGVLPWVLCACSAFIATSDRVWCSHLYWFSFLAPTGNLSVYMVQPLKMTVIYVTLALVFCVSSVALLFVLVVR